MSAYDPNADIREVDSRRAHVCEPRSILVRSLCHMLNLKMPWPKKRRPPKRAPSLEAAAPTQSYGRAALLLDELTYLSNADRRLINHGGHRSLPTRKCLDSTYWVLQWPAWNNAITASRNSLAERLTGCLSCNLWSVSGEKLWIELSSVDVAHALQKLRRAEASKRMPKVHRSSS
jgi:hypothetical protein